MGVMPTAMKPYARVTVVAVAALWAGLPAVAQVPAGAELFVVANDAAGVDAPHRGSWPEFAHEVFTTGYLGIGQAWGDWDNDGWVDLFLAGGQSPSMLYRNDGDGTFSVPRQAADVALADAWTGGAVWADYDNDGWRDLYVLTHGANVLFRNEGGARFRDVTAAAGVGDAGKGATAAWGDYDGDGFLDLFVANWRCYPDCPREHAAALASDRLYRNRGDGTFEDVELEPGQVSLHDVYLMHGSEPNTSGRPRRGMTLRFMPTSSVYHHDLRNNAVDAGRTVFLMRGTDRSGRNDFRLR